MLPRTRACLQPGKLFLIGVDEALNVPSDNRCHCPSISPYLLPSRPLPSLSFAMSGGKSQGMPAPVKAVLSKFSGRKEEDRMVGYLSFLKIGPQLLRFIPGKKARDLRNWLTVYGYWNQVCVGGGEG